MINTLYQQQLIDHYRYPRNRARLKNPDFTSKSYNPSCGDSVSFCANVRDHRLETVVFQGSGCVISQATASLLTQAAKNKAINDILAFDKNFVLKLIGMNLGLARLKCALLPLQALQEGLISYQKNQE